MKVLLLQDVKGQGKKGQIINVSDGYANNFLLKKGLGVVATADTINSIAIHDKAVERQKAEEKQAAIDAANALKGTIVKITSTKGANGKMFGSITNKEIADELGKMGFKVDKKQIALKSPIKTAGNYPVTVKMYAEISTNITVVVD
ncbi:MAG: 50S ribosomal protein L9 [Clostridia bacterium]|nr:50S ribosomal protein L9 [Clostridia bacterium]